MSRVARSAFVLCCDDRVTVTCAVRCCSVRAVCLSRIWTQYPVAPTRSASDGSLALRRDQSIGSVNWNAENVLAADGLGGRMVAAGCRSCASPCESTASLGATAAADGAPPSVSATSLSERGTSLPDGVCDTLGGPLDGVGASDSVASRTSRR
eukprot:5289575-Prymnesium_polylepis.1